MADGGQPDAITLSGDDRLVWVLYKYSLLPSLILLLTARPFTTSLSTTISSDLIFFLNMHFSLPLLSVLLMAATALAAPQPTNKVCNLVF